MDTLIAQAETIITQMQALVAAMQAVPVTTPIEVPKEIDITNEDGSVEKESVETAA